MIKSSKSNELKETMIFKNHHSFWRLICLYCIATLTNYELWNMRCCRCMSLFSTHLDLKLQEFDVADGFLKHGHYVHLLHNAQKNRLRF